MQFRVLVAGNLANYGYNFTKLLRNQGIDANLLMQRFPGSLQDPKLFEKDMNKYPEWIRFWNNHDKRWKIEVIQIMREYDLIHATTELPIFAMFSGKPFVVFPTGDDINELAFKKTLKGILLKLAYKKAKAVIYAGPYMHEAVQRLKLKNAIFIAPPWNYTKFTPATTINENKKCVFFHPTHHIWRSKRNDTFLRAYARLCKEREDVHLVLINRGEDFEKSINLLKDPSCQGKYEILPATVSQNEMPKLYNNADFIVDAFTGGSTGLIGQEAMASGKPLISYINKDLYQFLYGSIPPILSCSTEEEVLSILRKAVDNKHEYREIGTKSREWILKYHNPDNQIKKFIFIYESILQNVDLELIRKNVLLM